MEAYLGSADGPLAVATLVAVLIGFWLMLRRVPKLILLLLLLGLLFLGGLMSVTQPAEKMALLLLIGLILLVLLRGRR